MPLMLIAFLLVLSMATDALAQTPRSGQLEELKQLSIEELADTDVTSVQRRLERLGDVGAAVTVITGEDLRRMGVMNLAQAMRLAGHLHVSQVSGPQYAISARGFAISTANKLLVLIDGRTVYSPVFTGVFWETQDVMLADVDRIEVTRGPGGSVWGANAVNGVINVITKAATETKGTLVNVAVGTSSLGPYVIRHGGRLGAAGAYRAYAKVRFEGSHQLLNGNDAFDDFDFGQVGFRAESDPSQQSQFVLQGDMYTGTTGLSSTAEANLSGGNLLGRWTRSSANNVTSIQVYFDHTYRRVPGQYRGVLNTIDVDAQHNWSSGRHNIVFGGGYRRYDGDDLGDGPGFFFDPRERTSHRVGVFGQDEIRIGGGVFVTIGSKFERNEFSGFEFQPTIVARWSRPRRSYWASVSRAVRVPSRFDTDLRFRLPGSTTGALLLTGSPTFQSESLIAYEAGYRRQLRERVSIDIAGYVNRYDDLRTQEIRAGQPITLANMMNATTRGVESMVSAQILPRWQIHGSHAYFWKELTFDPGSTDITRGANEGNDPSNIFKLRSYINATNRIEIDAFFRYVGDLPQPAVDAYSELDLRLGYRVMPGWDLSLIGTNLLHDRHLEFRAGTQPETYERAVSLRSVWRF
jgi:iron complex outermembrane receptor protein